MQKVFHGLGQDFFCIKFLVVSDFEALFKCAKEVNILIVVHCFKIGVNLGVFNICDIWENSKVFL